MSRVYDVDKHLQWPIDELADDIEYEIGQSNVPYDDPMNADSWYDNFEVKCHRAKTVMEMQSLFTLRQEVYPHRCYHIYLIMQAHPHLDDLIGVEYLIKKPDPNFFSSEEEDTDTDEGPEPEIEE